MSQVINDGPPRRNAVQFGIFDTGRVDNLIRNISLCRYLHFVKEQFISLFVRTSMQLPNSYKHYAVHIA